MLLPQDKCVTAYEKQCRDSYRTEYKRQCATTYEQSCSTSYQTSYKQVLESSNN